MGISLSEILPAMWPVFLIFGLTFLLIILMHFITRNSQTRSKRIPPKNYKYQRRPSLLTQNEMNFYKSLQSVAATKRLMICPKVRLADLIEPQKGQPFQPAFTRIQAKHIDFVLCEPSSFKPVLAIELDDSSHDRPDRIRRDEFVDTALHGAGLPILHTRSTAGLSEKISELYPAKSGSAISSNSCLNKVERQTKKTEII